MSKKWLWLLAGGLTACGGRHLEYAVAVKHQHEQAFSRQLDVLQTDYVKLAAGLNGNPPTALTLELRNVQSAPDDTLRQRVRKLAHLLVLDLARPDAYQTLSVRVSEQTGFFKPAADPQFFIYPLASLR